MLTVQCPNCGSFNDSSAAVCYFCKKELHVSPDSSGKGKRTPSSVAGPAGIDRDAAFRRPGCVSIYAVLIFLSAVLGICFALYLPTFLANYPSEFLQSTRAPIGVDLADPEFVSFLRSNFMVYSIVLFLFSILTLLVGWGLWGMRNWARILILISQGISLIAGVLVLFLSIMETKGNLFVCGVNLLSLVIPGIIFFWFLLNRKLFR